MECKVWNDDERDWTEDFKEQKIRIPAKGFIVMGKSEANQLVSKYSPVVRDGAGNDIRPKKLRIEFDPEVLAEHMDQPLKYTSMDGKQFRTVEGLRNYENGIKAEVADGRKKPAKSGETA